MRDPRCERSPRDPVELLLRRVAYGALHGTLLATAASCAERDEAREESAVAAALEAGAPADREAASDGHTEENSDGGSTPRGADGAVSAWERPPGADAYCAQRTGFPIRAEALTPSEAIDYVAIRLATTTNAPRAPDSPDAMQPTEEAWTHTRFEVLSERGTPCASASTPECSAKVRRHPAELVAPDCTRGGGCREYSLITTRADAVERSATAAEVLGKLAPIDTADEALLIALAHGYGVTCIAPGSLAAELRGARYVLPVEGGFELLGERTVEICPLEYRIAQLRVGTDGSVRELDARSVVQGACVGRVPAGLRPRALDERELGAYLASCAHLEAASVLAFERLARELAAHDAPPSLIARAREAARDEVRHAGIVGALARARGAEPPPPEVTYVPLRPLAQIALENAVEGCLRETYGAVIGHYQAERAADSALRRAMGPIARDETRHALLSHDLHAWLMPRLSARTQARVRRAQLATLQILLADTTREPPQREAAGLPPPDVARAILTTLARTLWSLPIASA